MLIIILFFFLLISTEMLTKNFAAVKKIKAIVCYSDLLFIETDWIFSYRITVKFTCALLSQKIVNLFLAIKILLKQL